MTYHGIFAANQPKTVQHGKSVIIRGTAHIMGADSDFGAGKRQHVPHGAGLYGFAETCNLCIVRRVLVNQKRRVNLRVVLTKITEKMIPVIPCFGFSFGNQPHIAIVRKVTQQKPQKVRCAVVQKITDIDHTAHQLFDRKNLFMLHDLPTTSNTENRPLPPLFY